MPNRILIIGAGPGGYVAALRAAQLGAEVVLAEKGEVGGTCLNHGCIPSKVLKTGADMCHKLRRSENYGFSSDQSRGLQFDLALLMARKQEVIQIQAQGIRNLLHKNKVALLRGDAHITGMYQAEVVTPEGDIRQVAWDRLIIATGTLPRALEPVPFDGKTVLSNEHLLNLRQLPRSILIVGGGVIGCEFASILSALGVRVTIVEALSRILPLDAIDHECAVTLTREMKKQKITIYTDHVVAGVRKDAGAASGLRVDLTSLDTLKIETRKEALSVDVERVVVSVGRVPDLDGLGLATIGVKTDEAGWVVTDDCLRTNIAHVYAVGDILGPAKFMLAHVASAEGIKAAENACGANNSMNYEAIPGAVFSVPEIAGVGLTEMQAQQVKRDVRIDKVHFRSLAKAHIINEINGFVKMVSDPETHRLLGMHIIGPHATELIAEGTMAIQNNCNVQAIAQTLHAHPTLSEVLMETALKSSDKIVHG